MLDFFNLPGTTNADVKVFYANNLAYYITNNNLQFQTWHKPKGCSMVYMWGIGPGGYGGAGGVGAINSAGGGGGGGGGGTMSLLIPAKFLPDELYISVSYSYIYSGGDLGGSPTYICLAPKILNLTNLVLAANSGNYAGNGSSTAGGTGGMGAVAFNTSSMILCTAGIYSAAAGQSGTTGGHASAGSAQGAPAGGTLYNGGTGGGGLPGNNSAGYNGGDINYNPDLGWYSPGAIGPAAGADTKGTNGGNGFKARELPWWFGGTGGSSQSTSATPSIAGGGDGGAGGYGAGGGGGGAGFTGSTASAGGRGGDGLAIIISW